MSRTSASMLGVLLVVAGMGPGCAFAGVDVFSVGGCQGLTGAERERIEALDRTLTARAARSAVREVQRRLDAPLAAPLRRPPTPDLLALQLEGWMLKKEWLAARARREHDADEALTYCLFLRRATQLPP